jgi:serine/threonine protein kinase
MAEPWERPSVGFTAGVVHAPHPLLPGVAFSPVAAAYRDFAGGRRFWVVTFAVSGSSFAVVSRIRDSQHGWVLKAASVVLHEGRWEWGQSAAGAYVFSALKVEDKARVEAARERGRAGDHVDSSLLDRALLQRLAHSPATLRLHECGHDDAFLYCVTELAAGEPLLLASLDSRPAHLVGVLAEDEARTVVRAVCSALAELHGAGWCHKDVSPENVVCMPAPAFGARLIDFGSAMPMTRAGWGGAGADGRAWAPFPPARGGIVTKFPYACPAYVYGEGWRGVEFDMFSVGATLYHFLCGRKLYPMPHPSNSVFAALLESNDQLLARAWAAAGGGAPATTGGGGKPPPWPAAAPPPPAAALEPFVEAHFTPFEVILLELVLELRTRGLPPPSTAALDLLARTVRITPAFRPPCMATLLATHPFFAESA